jgi:voltage-gated potassium channel
MEQKSVKVDKIKKKIRSLFAGKTKKSQQFHIILMILNIFVFSLFIIEAAFPEKHSLIKIIEVFFGILFLFEYILQLWVSKRKGAYIFNIFNMIDVLVIASLFIPLFVGNFAALRIIKWIRIFRVYRIMHHAKIRSITVAHHWDITTSIVNFIVFLLVTTIVIYASQVSHNPNINTYIDALYFAVATLTTTGYGDVTVVGQGGKLISVFAMIIGMLLFIRMSREMFFGKRVHVSCKKCGLSEHEIDSIHCRFCGEIIQNPLLNRKVLR